MNILDVLVLFVVLPVMVIGYAGLYMEWHDRGLPIPKRPAPAYIFRLVKRDERAVYVRIMRRTLAVQMRDMSRQFAIVQRVISKALLPSIQRLADNLSRILSK